MPPHLVHQAQELVVLLRARSALRTRFVAATGWMHRSTTRVATADDLPLLHAGVLDAAFPPSPRPPFDEAIRVPHVARMVDGWPRSGDAGVIAMRGKRPVGAAWYRLFAADELRSRYARPDVPELVIAVASRHRRQGWGGTLLEALAEQACAEGHRALDLQVGLSNTRALLLYRERGWETVGDPEGDRVWMRRSLLRGFAPSSNHAPGRREGPRLMNRLDDTLHLGAAWSRISSRHDQRLRSALIVDERYEPYKALPQVQDPEVSAEFDRWRNRVFHARLYDLQAPCWVEPTRGYVIGRGGLVANASFAYWETMRPRIANLGHCVSARVARRAVHYDTVVSMRTHHEGNYYHFWDDFLGTLRAVEELDLADDVPFLIGPQLYQAHFFRHALCRSALGRHHWLPHDRVVHANRAIFGHAGSLRIAHFEYAQRLLNVEQPAHDPARRIFLTRARARGRFVRNEDALAEALAPLGFETKDADALALDEQIELFAGASAVVAVHGAGLANIQFRRGRPLALIELFPADYVHPPFAWLSAELGFAYDAVRGSECDATGGFTVDEEALSMALARSLGSSSR